MTQGQGPGEGLHATTDDTADHVGTSDGRTEGNWAAPVESLKVERRPGVRGTNVDGRRLHGAIQGFGKLWQKTYTVSGLAVSPEHAIAEWKAHFAEFWPPGNRFAGSLTGIRPGEVALLDLAIGGTKLSTGVLVLYADDRSFTFMTPQGHMFGGWITFSAEPEPNGTTMVQAQVLMRASDPVYEAALALGGHRKEDVFWRRTLTAVARHLGEPDPKVSEHNVCVDKRRQWSRWRNVWYNAAIRSVGQTVTGPVRRSESPGRGERQVAVQTAQADQPGQSAAATTD